MEEGIYNLGNLAPIRDEIRKLHLNPFTELSKQEQDNPLLFYIRHCLNPDHFWFFCKYILNFEPYPFQIAIMKTLWEYPFPMFIATRGGSKSSILALYAIIKAALIPGHNVVLVGAGFRQSKQIFQYAEKIWHNAPILRDLFAGYPGRGISHDTDKWTLTLGDSVIFAIPVGSGETIRGYRAGTVIADEFNSINVDIYETVISGFSSVSSNPRQATQYAIGKDILQKVGLWTERDDELEKLVSPINQNIIAGTCGYEYQHFADYHKKWRDFIESKGDKKKISVHFGGKEENIEDGFDWRHYAVIRLPHYVLPPKLLSKEVISKAKGSMSEANFLREYCAIFPSDSDSYFSRKTIDNCCIADTIETEDGRLLHRFHVMLKGDPAKEYVMGVDPASEVDNFAIVIIELNQDYRKVVYCWTTNKKRHEELVRKGLAQEHNYYGYCEYKIRDLMKRFNIVRIALDSQGGGYSLYSALSNPDDPAVNAPLLEIVEKNKKKESDNKAGLHIVELIQFAKATWVSQANQFLRTDLEQQNLLFPYYDNALMTVASYKESEERDDGIDRCMDEIEELKDELSSIVREWTENRREKFLTPEKVEGGKKGRQLKDRYSAILMANMGARQLIEGLATNVQMDDRCLGTVDMFEATGAYSEDKYYTDDRLNEAFKRMWE